MEVNYTVPSGLHHNQITKQADTMKADINVYVGADPPKPIKHMGRVYPPKPIKRIERYNPKSRVLLFLVLTAWCILALVIIAGRLF